MFSHYDAAEKHAVLSLIRGATAVAVVEVAVVVAVAIISSYMVADIFARAAVIC